MKKRAILFGLVVAVLVGYLYFSGEGGDAATFDDSDEFWELAPITLLIGLAAGCFAAFCVAIHAFTAGLGRRIPQILAALAGIGGGLYLAFWAGVHWSDGAELVTASLAVAALAGSAVLLGASIIALIVGAIAKAALKGKAAA